MSFEVVIRQFTVVGTRHSAKFKEYPVEIPKAIQALLPRSVMIANRTGRRATLYEPGIKAEPENIGTFLVTNEVTEIGTVPDGMDTKEIPEREYVLYIHKGEVSNIGEAYSAIHSWISENGQYDEGYIIERCVENYNPNSTESEMEIYMPFRSK